MVLKDRGGFCRWVNTITWLPSSIASSAHPGDASFIDRAENRHKFSSMLDELKIDQPRWRELTSFDEIDSLSTRWVSLLDPSFVRTFRCSHECCHTKEQ